MFEFPLLRQFVASTGPVIAATDYVRAVPESVRAFFHVDAASIVRAALGSGH